VVGDLGRPFPPGRPLGSLFRRRGVPPSVTARPTDPALGAGPLMAPGAAGSTTAAAPGANNKGNRARHGAEPEVMASRDAVTSGDRSLAQARPMLWPL
jgi:hypothetical protein